MIALFPYIDGLIDGANIEIAEEIGESNVCEYNGFLYIHLVLSNILLVFFGHLTPAVEDLRHQHLYHPVPIEEKSPRLAKVLDQISAGMFGDGHVYEPCEYSSR